MREKIYFSIIGLFFLSIISVQAEIITIPLPDLEGSLGATTKSAAIDCQAFQSIESVRFMCSGTAYPGTGRGDGVECPIFPYFSLPVNIQAYMPAEPYGWHCSITPSPGVFSNKQQYFSSLPSSTFDFLMDGQAIIDIYVSSGVSFCTVVVVPSTAYITEAYLIIDGLPADTFRLMELTHGNMFLAGTTCKIEWIDTFGGDNCQGNYLLEYSIDNGNNWSQINSVPISNVCSYAWVVPSVTSDQCLIRLTDIDNPTLVDISDNTFYIYQCQASISGDYNNDCYIQLDDYAILASKWLNGNCQYQNDWCTGADSDRSGVVDISDLIEFAGNWCQCANPYDAHCQ